MRLNFSFASLAATALLAAMALAATSTEAQAADRKVLAENFTSKT